MIMSRTIVSSDTECKKERPGSDGSGMRPAILLESPLFLSWKGEGVVFFLKNGLNPVS